MAKESVPTAYELLFQKLFEIAKIMQENDKKTAVSVIRTQFPEFADMSENTIKTNITSFPFLVSEFSDLKSSLDTVKEANKMVMGELDTIRQENTALYNELDSLRQELAKEKNKSQIIDNLETENESLKIEIDNLRQKLDNDKSAANKTLETELDDFRQYLDKGLDDMDVVRELQDLKNRVVAIETVIQGNVSQRLDKKTDKDVSNLDIPEFIDGWKVVFKTPYWKLYKTINGKLQWIHIGREFSEDKAKEKIRQKIAKLDSE